MNFRKRLAALLALAVSFVFAGTAMAAFPNFSGCPTSNPAVVGCLDVQSVSGSLEIKGFTVPLGDSLEIRGGLTAPVEEEGPASFIPPAGTNGFFSKPIRVPGGLLGIEFPIPGNTVLATAQLAGSASQIEFRFGLPITTISLPIKVKLDNPIIGLTCYIGTNSRPVRLNLTTGTTSPPPPNRPISGSLGRAAISERVVLTGSVAVDNAFAIPGASGCGLLGIANPLVNLKLKLPSAAGNNTMIIQNNVALQPL